jgi:pyridoxamine 5'-phosphate oxidase
VNRDLGVTRPDKRPELPYPDQPIGWAVALNERMAEVHPPDPAGMRRDYRGGRAGEPLTEATLSASWLEQFQRWFAEATAAPEIVEPNAMVVATATPAGAPSARTVLLKGVDERGFVFYTNYNSRKAHEIGTNPAVSLVFPWHPIGRQVIVEGVAERVTRAETEAYFARRPRASQLGAWASPQSQVITRAELEAALTEVVARFPEPDPVPAPPHWGGLLVRPHRVEFWQGGTGRLHDRLRYRRTGQAWVVERLAP